MNLKKKIVTLLICTASANSYAYEINMARCATWGDSLDANQAAGRWQWAKACDPTIKLLAEQMPHLLPPENGRDEAGRDRRTYPVYGAGSKGNWVNPHRYFAPTSATAGCNLPADYKLAFLCFAGCYTPDQVIAFADKDLAIAAADKNGEKFVQSFSQVEDGLFESTIRPIEFFTASAIDGEHEVYKFSAENGNDITVTAKHPLIDGEGFVRTAESFTKEDSLLTPEGAVKIESIEKQKFYGKVHNLSVATENPAEKVIMAQGFLNADVTFQNENDILLGKMIFRLSGIDDQDVK